MKRELLVIVVLGSLLWAGTGLSVLAVAIHEQRHHSDHHDHIQAFRTALHGHSHENTPEHDHEPAAQSVAGKTRVVVQPLSLDYSTQECFDARPTQTRCNDAVGCAKEHDPPPYLILGVFLT